MAVVGKYPKSLGVKLSKKMSVDRNTIAFIIRYRLLISCNYQISITQQSTQKIIHIMDKKGTK